MPPPPKCLLTIAPADPMIATARAMRVSGKTWVWTAVAIGAIAALVWAFLESPLLVDVAEVRRGLLRVTVTDDGRTRVRERYTVCAPVHGRLVRTTLDPGDPVQRGETVLAVFAPSAPQPLDPRSREQAEAQLGQARANLRQTRALLEQTEADVKLTTSECERVRKLVVENIASTELLDRAQHDQARAEAARRGAEFAVAVAEFGQRLAQANLVELQQLPTDDTHREANRKPSGGTLVLHAPIQGTVLRVFEESERDVAPGTPLLEIGDVSRIELVADFLSQDAVKVRPKMRAFVRGFGGEHGPDRPATLEARVRLVEPSGFTKVSALGVEEQRVNVIADPVGDDPQWRQLGDGFRIELSVELWSAEDVLQVPTGALFKAGGAWAVYAVSDGRAQRRQVKIGRRSGLEAEVLEGLEPGTPVVLYPSELVQDGGRVAPRRAAVR